MGTSRPGSRAGLSQDLGPLDDRSWAPPAGTMHQAQAHMAALAERLEKTYPEFNANWGVKAEPLRRFMQSTWALACTKLAVFTEFENRHADIPW
jgi:hypothetical protein